MGKVLNWIKKSGGIKAMYENSLKKSQLVYDRIDKSGGFYSCPIEKAYRSRMNIVFRVGGLDGDEALEKEFLKGAEEFKMLQLKGHRSVGGIRASLYNAVTLDDTETLVKHMDAFLAKHKKWNEIQSFHFNLLIFFNNIKTVDLFIMMSNDHLKFWMK